MSPQLNSGGGSAAYSYVGPSQPAGASEGDSWYDTDNNEAYVYDGASWHKQTVADHGELSGIGASDHHARPSAGTNLTEDANANFNAPTSTGNASKTRGLHHPWTHPNATDGDSTTTMDVGNGKNHAIVPKYGGYITEFEFTVDSRNSGAKMYLKPGERNDSLPTLNTWSPAATGTHTYTFTDPVPAFNLSGNTYETRLSDLKIKTVEIPSHSHTI